MALKKSIKWFCLIIGLIIVFKITTNMVSYNSLSSKNTRYLEQILSEDITSGKDSANGNVKDLIALDYDKMHVFGPYQPVEEMEKQIGFKYSKLKQGLSEGMNNILFVKDNSVAAYLFGYPSNTGYYINIPIGEYNKEQIDNMAYIMEERQVGNSAGTPKIYMFYEFIDLK